MRGDGGTGVPPELSGGRAVARAWGSPRVRDIFRDGVWGSGCQGHYDASCSGVHLSGGSPWEGGILGQNSERAAGLTGPGGGGRSTRTPVRLGVPGPPSASSSPTCRQPRRSRPLSLPATVSLQLLTWVSTHDGCRTATCSGAKTRGGHAVPCGRAVQGLPGGQCQQPPAERRPAFSNRGPWLRFPDSALHFGSYVAPPLVAVSRQRSGRRAA